MTEARTPFRMILDPRLLACLCLCVLAAGCGTKRVAIAPEFPAPVMAPLPYRVALQMDDAFRNVRHSESLPTGGSWEIDLGAANVGLFERVTAGMFQHVVAGDVSVSAVDLRLQPALADFQFSTPEQNASAYYEAWLQYRIRVLRPDGTLITEWMLPAYGRAPEQTLAAEASMGSATRIAMRDAAAGMVLEFLREPAIRQALGLDASPADGRGEQ